jgi:hypothetical protein
VPQQLCGSSSSKRLSPKATVADDNVSDASTAFAVLQQTD